MIKQELHPGVLHLELTGDLDLTQAYEFDREMREIETGDATTFVLDLRGVSFLDSAGLARILAASRRAEQAGRRFVLVRGSKPVDRLFALTALDHKFEMVRDPQAVTPR